VFTLKFFANGFIHPFGEVFRRVSSRLFGDGVKLLADACPAVGVPANRLRFFFLRHEGSLRHLETPVIHRRLGFYLILYPLLYQKQAGT